MKWIIKIVLLWLYLAFPVFSLAATLPNDSTRISALSATNTPTIVYKFILNLNGQGCFGWCNTTWTTQSLGLAQAAFYSPWGGQSVLPGGTYNAFLTVNGQDFFGRWQDVANLGVGYGSPTIGLISSGNMGRLGKDGTIFTTIAYSFIATNVVVPPGGVLPYFFITYSDSSHNETPWIYSGTVTFARQ